MNHSVDQVVVRVEGGSERQLDSWAAASRTHPRHVEHSEVHDPRMLVCRQENEAKIKSDLNSTGKLNEHTNDAIWEEVILSPDVAKNDHTSIPQGLQTLKDLPVLPLRQEKETTHRSLDFDIHISEPDLVKLQDQTCKPLSDHLAKSDFSLPPKGSAVPIATSQRTPKLAISSKDSPRHGGTPSPRQPDASSSRKGEEVVKRQAARESVPEEAANVVSVSPRRSNFNDERCSSRCSTLTRDVYNGLASHQLHKTKTKSRFVEPAYTKTAIYPQSPWRAATPRPQSPLKPSSSRFANKAEDDEEDPFKDIDYPDTFRQGNWKCITIAQWIAFFILITCLVCSLTVRVVEHHQVWGLELWKWFLLALVVFCGRLVSGWLIRLIVMIFERNFLLRKRVLYFVYGLRKAVQNCLWLGLALFAWKLMFDPKVERATNSHKALSLVTKALECFLIAAAMCLLKTLLVKVLASSFHVSTFFDRIQDSLFNQHVLEALSGPPLLDLGFERRNAGPLSMGTATKGVISQSINVEEVQKLEPKDVSAGLMKGLINLFTHPGIGTLVTTIDESVTSEETPQDVAINNEMQAKAAAKRIFKNVAQPDSRIILKEDLLRFLHSEEVDRIILSFEGAKDREKITRKALKNWVVKVYQDRKALAHSLNDTKTAVDELHRVASVIVAIIIVIVWLLVFEIATTHILLLIASQLLLAGFMFGNTVKQVFEAIVFVFVMHPYDVGDRCVIDGDMLMVEEMNILTTVFLRFNNEKVYYPNAVLATKPISNLYRSPVMKDALDFSVHISTPSEKIVALKEKISEYVRGKSEHWHPKFSVLVKELEDLNRMRLSILMQHTINFQNLGDRSSRRSDLLLELRKYFHDLAIEYRLLPQPVYLTMQPPPTASSPPFYNHTPTICAPIESIQS